MTGTSREPDGTELVTQLGGAVGGPEVPADPETETVDLRRKLGEATRLAESWVMEDGIRRGDGLSLLAVLRDAALPVAAVLERPTIDAEAPETAGPTDDARVPRLCPTCLHDGALERALERAVAAEGKLAEVGAYWLVTDEDGDIILNAPCADTLGCLWSSRADGERVTLGELIAAAGTHAGLAAGQAHAALAVATGEAEEGPPNGGNPVIHSGAVAPGGWVCAVPAPGNPDHICGMPVESEPCTEHGEPAKDGSEEGDGYDRDFDGPVL